MFGRNNIFMERPNSHWEANLEMPRRLSAGKKSRSGEHKTKVTWHGERWCILASENIWRNNINNHVGFRWFGCNVGFLFSTFFHFHPNFFSSFTDSDILLWPMISTTSTNYSKQKLTPVVQITTLPGDVAKLPERYPCMVYYYLHLVDFHGRCIGNIPYMDPIGYTFVPWKRLESIKR